jgi:1-acyl-sn-glycerol-3-phosphate acyltransferase
MTPTIISALVLLLPALVLGWHLWHRMQNAPYGPLVGFLLGLDRVYCRLWCRLTTSGPSPIPDEGAAIVIANHTSPLDPLVLQAGTPRPIGFFFAREYYDFLGLRRVWRRLGCIPVNRTGYDAAATKAGVRRLSEGELVGVFPEGRMNLDGSGLLPGRYGAAMLALRARVPVVPAVISGAPLGHTMIRPYFVPCRIHVKYGEPIDLRSYYRRPIDRQLLSEVTTLMMRELARLGGMPCPRPYQGRVPPVNGKGWKPPLAELAHRASA